MLRFGTRRVRAAIVVALLVPVLAPASPAGAAPIATESSGTFGLCLQSRSDHWLRTQAERLANGDPAVASLDDAAVAAWAARTIDTCKSEAGRTDAASESNFVKHMARWREHVDTAAQLIRLRSPAD